MSRLTYLIFAVLVIAIYLAGGEKGSADPPQVITPAPQPTGTPLPRVAATANVRVVTPTTVAIAHSTPQAPLPIPETGAGGAPVPPRPDQWENAGTMLEGAGKFFAAFARLLGSGVGNTVNGQSEPVQTLIGLTVFILFLLALIGLRTLLTFGRVLRHLGG